VSVRTGRTWPANDPSKKAFYYGTWLPFGPYGSDTQDPVIRSLQVADDGSWKLVTGSGEEKTGPAFRIGKSSLGSDSPSIPTARLQLLDERDEPVAFFEQESFRLDAIHVASLTGRRVMMPFAGGAEGGAQFLCPDLNASISSESLHTSGMEAFRRQFTYDGASISELAKQEADLDRILRDKGLSFEERRDAICKGSALFCYHAILAVWEASESGMIADELIDGVGQQLDRFFSGIAKGAQQEHAEIQLIADTVKGILLEQLPKTPAEVQAIFRQAVNLEG
jgi:hypothetical protein